MVIKELENDKTALYEILWYLQTTTPESAGALLQRLSSNPGNDIGAILQHFAQHRRDTAGIATPSSIASTSFPHSQSTTPSVSNVVESLHPPQLFDARGSVVQPNDMTSQATRNEFATVYGLEGPLEWFFNCVGTLFYILDQKEIFQSLKLLQTSADARIPLGDLVATRKDMRTTTTAAELAGIASIGVVHAQLADPAIAPPAELADYFYAVAKMGLDAAIQYNPVRAVKICALLAIYNIVVHATVALAYVGKR